MGQEQGKLEAEVTEVEKESSTPPHRFVKAHLRIIVKDRKAPYYIRMQALQWLAAIDGILLTKPVGRPSMPTPSTPNKEEREFIVANLEAPPPSPKKMSQLEELLSRHATNPEIPEDFQ